MANGKVGRPRSIRIGEKIGELTVIAEIGYKDWQLLYKCRCSCGNEVVRSNKTLTKARRCGNRSTCQICRPKWESGAAAILKPESRKKSFKARGIHLGTDVLRLMDEKLRKDNTTGVRGVTKLKNGKYLAYIWVGKNRKSVYCYSLEEAAEERQRLFEKYAVPVIREFEAERRKEHEKLSVRS